MYTRLKKSLLISFLMLWAAGLDASIPSCPSGYGTSTHTDPNGVQFTVCYPEYVQLNQSPSFTIYVYIEVTATGGTEEYPTLYSFLPPTSSGMTATGYTQTGGNTVPRSVLLTDQSPNGDGAGQINYTNGITQLQVQSFTFNLTATAVGPYSYTPHWTEVTGGAPSGDLPTITINVINCPTITADSFTGCDSGSVSGHVGGGSAPYTYFATGTQSGGTVTLNSNGNYSFSTASGSFQYQATDASGCASSVGTVHVANPTGGGNIFATTTFGTPATATVVSGGTPPYVASAPIQSSNIAGYTFDPNTGQLSVTQSAAGASFIQLNITDANGCTLTNSVNFYAFSCDTGYTANAVLFNNLIYSICAPSTVIVGRDFDITVSIINPTNSSQGAPDPFDDIVPDSSQLSAAGLVFISNTPEPSGTVFVSSGSQLNEGGMGSFGVGSGNVPANTTYSVVETVSASSLGNWSFTAAYGGNPPSTFTVSIDVINCPTITGIDASVTACAGATYTGDLSTQVTGGSAPYTFYQSGPISCSPNGTLTFSSTGPFSFTSATGFTGPCSFEFYAVDSNNCTGNLATYTINVQETPIASDLAFTVCEAGSYSGTLPFVSGGDPVTVAIVTQPANGIIGNFDSTTGAFTYVPNVGYVGTDSFTFNVTDNTTNCVSNTATVNITVQQGPAAQQVNTFSCGNTAVGSLASYVSLGTPPYTYAQIGTINCGPSGATVAVDPTTGGFTFAVGSPGYTGTCNFVYQVTDASGCTDSAQVNLLANVAPVGINQTANACGTNTLNGTLSATGGSGDYSYSLVSASGGSAIVSATGGYSFTPSASPEVGSLTFQVTDNGNNCTGSGEVTINVAFPAVSATAINSCVDGSVSGELTSLVSGGYPGYTFSDTGTSVGGAAVVSSTGGFTYTPNPGFSGPGSFNYQVTDTNNCTVAGTVDVNVTSPVAFGLLIYCCTNGSASGTLTGLVSSGTPPYTFALQGTPTNGTAVVSADGSYTFTATPGFEGNGQFDYQVTDANGCTAAAPVFVTISTPVLAGFSVDGCVNGTVSGNLAGQASSGFPPYTFSATGSSVGGVASVSSTGLYSYTANNGFSGIGGFDFQVTDSNNCIATGHASVLVLSPIAQNGTGAVCVNGSRQGSVSGLVSSGYPPYTYSIVGGATGGSVTMSPTSGIYAFTAANGFSGAGGFVYQATDTNNCIGTGAIDITVDSPVSGNTSAICCVDGSVSGDISSLATGGFPPYLFGGPISQVGGVAVIGQTGNYLYTPNAGFSGAGNFVFEVSDSAGCTGDGTVFVTVSSPVTVTGTAYACINGQTGGTLSGLVNQGFPPYTYAVGNTAVGGIPTVGQTGIYTYAPDFGFSGQGSFTYTVTDSNNCATDGLVNVMVADPVTTPGSINVCGGGSLNGNLTGLVTGGIAPYSFVLTYVSEGVNVTLNADGSYTFTPQPGFEGSAFFEYQVTDSIGCTATGSVTATVSSVIAESSSANLCVDGVLNGSVASGVTGGFPPYTFSLQGGVTGGQVTLGPTSGLYTFTGASGFSGTGGFSYLVSDTNNCTASAGVTIAIHSPIAQNINASTCNDTLSGDLTTYVSDGFPPYTFTTPGLVGCTGAEFTLNPNGQFSFTAPSASYTGSCSFIYEVTDSNACTDLGSMVITPNTRTFITNPSYTGCSNVPYSNSLANTVVGGVPPLTFSQVGNAVNGTVALAADGVFTFTPNPDFIGTGIFGYQVTDSSTPPCISDSGTAAIGFSRCCPLPMRGNYYYLYRELLLGLTGQ